jgi:hypothetical protein
VSSVLGNVVSGMMLAFPRFAAAVTPCTGTSVDGRDTCCVRSWRRDSTQGWNCLFLLSDAFGSYRDAFMSGCLV